MLNPMYDTTAGLGDPLGDSRNALIAKGTATDVSLTNVKFNNTGCYLWEDADAIVSECSFQGGLHGLYIWGRCDVTASKTTIKDMELSGVNIRDGATVNLKVCCF